MIYRVNINRVDVALAIAVAIAMILVVEGGFWHNHRPGSSSLR